jgi:rhodanese-related sulfurtransferase
LPLSEFQVWHDKLNQAAEIVVMCHHGVRSAQVCAFLAGQGFKKVWNLSGGIDAWSKEVDRNVPRY